MISNKRDIFSIIGIFIILLFSFSCETNNLSNKNYLDKTNTKIPVLHLNISSFENGFSHGKLLKKEITENIDLWKLDLSKRFNGQSDSIIKKFLNCTNYVPTIKKWTPELYKELEGISKGAEIDFNTLFAFQLIDEFWAQEKFLANHHCTSLAVNNFRRNGEANYNAQTIDIPVFYHKNPVILNISTDKSSKLITTFAGYLGINGMNKNISVTENSLTALKFSKDGLPVAFVSREILDCKDFNEAVNFVKTIEHASGQNYIIASNKNIVSLECSADLVTEYWASADKLYTLHGNTPFTNNSFNENYRNQLITFYGAVPESIFYNDPKVQTLKKYFLDNANPNESGIKEILGSHSICNETTFLTTIMELGKSKNKMFISLNKSDRKKYFELTLEK